MLYIVVTSDMMSTYGQGMLLNLVDDKIRKIEQCPSNFSRRLLQNQTSEIT